MTDSKPWRSPDQKLFFKFKMVNGCNLENHFFGHNASNDYPISGKFCIRKQNGMLTKATWQKMLSSKIQDGRWPRFWTLLNRHISANNHPILMKFGTLSRLNPVTATWQKININIPNGRRPPSLKVLYRGISVTPSFDKVKIKVKKKQQI